MAWPPQFGHRTSPKHTPLLTAFAQAPSGSIATTSSTPQLHLADSNNPVSAANVANTASPTTPKSKPSPSNYDRISQKTFSRTGGHFGRPLRLCALCVLGELCVTSFLVLAVAI